MKVLHLNAGNETGGGMIHILSLLNEIKSEKFYLGLFEEGVFQEEAKKKGINTVTFIQKNRYDLSILSRVIHFIQENNIDIIHTHGARANLYGYFIKKKLTGITWVTTVHSDPRNDFLGRGIKGKLFTKLNIFVLKKVDHLFAISERFKEMLISFNIHSSKITTIYNGIDFNEKNEYNLKKIGKNLEIENEDFIIVMVARFDPVKRHTIAFSALKEVIKFNPNVKLLLIGDGPLKDKLVLAVQENHLENHVLFIGHQKNVDMYYQLADVTLLTSKTESFPLVLLESAREFTPVVTTDVGGVKKMIPDPSFGFIVEVDNVGEIKTALEKAIELKKNNELIYMGRKFYKYTSQHFSIQSFVSSIINVYGNLKK